MPATAPDQPSAASGWQLQRRSEERLWRISGAHQRQWTPVSRAQKNETGQFRVMPIGGDEIQAAPEPTSTALNVLMHFGHLAIRVARL